MDTDTEGPSIREALSSAIETHSEPAAEVAEAPGATPAAPPAKEAAASSTEAPAKGEASSTGGRDEKGRFSRTANGTAPPTSATPSVTAPPVAQDATKTGTPEPKPAVTTEAKAPQSWKPEARESWSAIPESARNEIVRREREAATALQAAAEKSKQGDGLRNAIAPYEANIRASGVDPAQAIQNLLQTEHALRTAPQPHKAEIMARLVKSYDISIEHLAAALDGQPAPQGQPQHFDPNQFTQQIKQQILGEFQQQRQQATFAKSSQEVTAFGDGREFFQDVREHMADLLEVAGRRGIPLTLEDAYNRACQLEPEVSKVIQQRAAATQANASNASTQRARVAASSVKSQPASVISDVEPEDRRALLEAAWARSQSR